MNDIKQYEYNGFKMYERTGKSYTNDEETIRILVQYKNGLQFKTWTQKIVKDQNNGEESYDWKPANYLFFEHDNEFLKNISEEEAFAILL